MNNNNSKSELSSGIKSALSESGFKTEFDNYYVLDTNIILEDANNIFEISQSGSNLIILPETVIDELDNKKSGFQEINYQARQFGRIISESTDVKSYSNGYFNVTEMIIDKNIFIHIISKDSYNTEDCDRSIINDRKIIDIANSVYKIYTCNGTLLSNDVMCRIRASSIGIESEGLLSKVNHKEHEFFIEKNDYNSSFFNTYNNKHILSVVPDHKDGTYCYLLNATDGNKLLGYVKNNTFVTMDEDELRRGVINPKNIGQQFALAGMIDPDIDLNIVEAPAGSGKTLLALSAGIKLVKSGHYSKIIYIRNSIESTDKAEEVGFLPGLESKFVIYNYPLYDSLNFIASNGGKKQLKQKEDDSQISEESQNLMEKYHIETVWPGAARGRTFHNAYVIIDETQNFSKSSLRTMMTRFDDQCKVVCIGSNNQIDNQYVNKHNNGLSVLLEKAHKNDHGDIVMYSSELKKIVRGKLTQWAEEAFA